jgi:PAS domain S-box-containing protein
MAAEVFPGVADNSQSLLSAIINSSDDAIISKDLQGIIRSWNPAASRIFGYTADEIVGQSILRLIPEELRYEEDMILSRIRAGERIEHYETIRMRKNGERFNISVTISPLKDVTGKVIGASKIARDISERHKKDELRFRLAAIVDWSDDAIVSKDLNGIITSWNPGAARIFGYSAEEMVGESILRLIPANLKHEEDMILAKIRAGERIEHYETTRVTKAGERIEVSVTISPIRDSLGQIVGASKIARDVSDRKRMERLVIQSEKLSATGRMAATVAHEINNPLESVMNLIYLARRSSAPNSKAFGYLETAEKELERVSHIARQTLGYYRETGSPIEVVLHDLANDVLTVYEMKLRSLGIAVDCDFEDKRSISVSKGELLQVFSNVISNAIDAMPGGGRLFVQIRETSHKDEAGVEALIRDSGTGILPEHLARIFEPFFTTKGNLGTGIGLWVSRQLVESRGGCIEIASSVDGKARGTAVRIFIPFVSEADHMNREVQMK